MMQTFSRNVIWLLSQVRVIFHRHTAWSCSTVPVEVVYWSRWPTMVTTTPVRSIPAG
jgi:hypothetical protein